MLAFGLSQAVVCGGALNADPEPTEAQILDALKAKRLTPVPPRDPGILMPRGGSALS
jgi:hypothetical protein